MGGICVARGISKIRNPMHIFLLLLGREEQQID